MGTICPLPLIMEAKEKADELVNRFYCKRDYLGLMFCLNYSNAKQCALIAVEEIINANPHSNPFNTNVYSTMEYWLKVKNEIEKL